MEKRKSERVQCFNAKDENGIQPVWVFRHTRPDSLLGLLVDISDSGVQIITSKDESADGQIFQLMISRNDADDGQFLTVFVNRKWTKDEGTLYVRHGFSFEDESDVSNAVRAIITASAEKEKWLRCELINVGTQ